MDCHSIISIVTAVDASLRCECMWMECILRRIEIFWHCRNIFDFPIKKRNQHKRRIVLTKAHLKFNGMTTLRIEGMHKFWPSIGKRSLRLNPKNYKSALQKETICGGASGSSDEQASFWFGSQKILSWSIIGERLSKVFGVYLFMYICLSTSMSIDMFSFRTVLHHLVGWP